MRDTPETARQKPLANPKLVSIAIGILVALTMYYALYPQALLRNRVCQYIAARSIKHRDQHVQDLAGALPRTTCRSLNITWTTSRVNPTSMSAS